MEISSLMVNTILASVLGYVISYGLAVLGLQFIKTNNTVSMERKKEKVIKSAGRIGLCLGALIILVQYLINNVNI